MRERVILAKEACFFCQPSDLKNVGWEKKTRVFFCLNPGHFCDFFFETRRRVFLACFFGVWKIFNRYAHKLHPFYVNFTMVLARSYDISSWLSFPSLASSFPTITSANVTSRATGLQVSSFAVSSSVSNSSVILIPRYCANSNLVNERRYYLPFW